MTLPIRGGLNILHYKRVLRQSEATVCCVLCDLSCALAVKHIGHDVFLCVCVCGLLTNSAVIMTETCSMRSRPKKNSSPPHRSDSRSLISDATVQPSVTSFHSSASVTLNSLCFSRL